MEEQRKEHREEHRVRIYDIAEELGLSTATVSNVIHGKTKKISDRTVKRVMALLEKRQYFPGVADILLAQNDSRIIGVFVNDHEKYEGHTLEDFFISSSINYLSTEIENSGRFMIIKKAKQAEEIIRFASMWNMEGIVVMGFCEQDYLYLRNHMRIPFVIYDGICGKTERIFNITLDNYGGGLQMGRYFKKAGHRKALCISDNSIGIDLDRMEGFREGFAHLEKIKSVTAIFAVSDYYAIDLMCFLNGQGISVPKDISVAGFDDIPVCQMINPPLTTIKQDNHLRAKLAIEKLKDLKENKETGTEIVLPVSLVVRKSTAPL